LKRSNRLVLLLGVLLAVAAFVGIVVVFNNQNKPVNTAPTALPTVYAKVDIPLGTVVTADMVETKPVDITVRPADAIGDPGVVIGKTVRTDVRSGAEMNLAMFSTGAGGGTEVASLLEPGLRAIAVQVDQSTGVGTLINVGDRVDMVVGFTGADKVPVVTVDPTTKALTPVAGINSTTTKLILQDMQVIGTLVPPAAPTTSGSSSGTSGASGGTTATTGTSLTGQQELVILAVTAQQAEVIKFAQIDGQISLVLRSPKDFRDAAGAPVVPAPDVTSGIVLKTLIDKFGVLPPVVIQATNLPQ
jgi:pilus assembly protein CpaB